GTKRRRQERSASTSTSLRRSKRPTSLEPRSSPEEDAVVSNTASRSPPSRGEREWSLESNGSGSSTASASKRRRRATIVAMEPRIEVIEEEEETAGAGSSISRIAYHTRSHGPSREVDQSVLTPKRRTSRRLSEAKAKISPVEEDDPAGTVTGHIVVDDVGEKSNSSVDDMANVTKNSLGEEAVRQEKELIVQEITDERNELREDVCSADDGIANMEKKAFVEEFVSLVMSCSPSDKKIDECTGVEEGEEAMIIFPTPVEEKVISKFNIESPSPEAVNLTEQDSNEEKINDPSQECTKHFDEIEPQDTGHMKGDDPLTNGDQEVDNSSTCLDMDEAHAREIVIEGAAMESRAIANAGIPSLLCSTSFKVESPTEYLSSKLNVVVDDDTLERPKAHSLGMVAVQVEQSLVINESSVDAKEMETTDDQLLQAEKREVEGLQATDGTKKQEVKTNDGRRDTEIEADEKSKTDEQLELDAEEEAKKQKFSCDTGIEDQKREAYKKVEGQRQIERCSSEETTEKGNTSGYEAISFREERVAIKENECPIEHSDDTEGSTELKKKKRKKSEPKASPTIKEGSEKAKKLDKHRDHMFCADFEQSVSGISEKEGNEALIGPLECRSSSNYCVLASKQNEVDMKEDECVSLLSDIAIEKETPKKKKKTKLVEEETDRLVHSCGAEKGDDEMEHDIDSGEDRIGYWPLIDDVTFLWVNRNKEDFLIGDLKRAYSFVANFGEGDVNLPNELLVENLESIWQQIAMRNKKVSKRFRKYATLLEVPVPMGKMKKKDKEDVERTRFEEATASEHNDVLEVEDGKDGADLFNLKEEDIKDLERELNELEDEEDEDIGERDKKDEISKREPRKYRKTVVDDRFFSLAEMEDYLNDEERKNASEGFFDDIEDRDDTADFPVDYHYSDFFSSVEEETSSAAVPKEKKTKKQKLTATSQVERNEESGKRKKKKKVHFDVDEENDDEETLPNGRINNENVEERPILLGAIEDERNEESEFEKRQKKMRSKIAAIEEANLAPRNWEMGGEVSSFERDENTLLEQHIAFDHSAKSAPIITVDSTTKLEALIIQRIKDKVFDDVERKVRELEAGSSYRASVEEPLVKKSLAEVYEEQFQKAQEGESRDVKVDEKIAEIEKLMNDLFKKLDALSHFRYIPAEVRPEVRIVSNVASLQKEEVGPMASTDDVLMAPEEIKKHEKGAVKSKEERDGTDRARERRKKKKMQRVKILSKRSREEQDVASSSVNKVSKKKKKKRRVDRDAADGDDRSTTENIKTTSFFKQLHQTVANELKEKSDETAKKKMRRLARHNAGAKYVL
uniref:Uncharacterized protein n=2 Tax=Parascaris univalens TaxID=6257 RepID=A0A915AP86_PARUN